LVPWTTRNLWRYELCVDDLIGRIVSAAYDPQMTLAGIPAMVMACVKPITINYAMCVNPFASNEVWTTQNHSWWYEDITRIDAAQ